MGGNREITNLTTKKRCPSSITPGVSPAQPPPQGPALHARCTLQRASLASWERRYDCSRAGSWGSLADCWLAGGGNWEKDPLVDFCCRNPAFYVYIYIFITNIYIYYLVAPEESWVGIFSPKIFSKSIEDFLLLYLLEIGAVFFFVWMFQQPISLFILFAERFGRFIYCNAVNEPAKI